MTKNSCRIPVLCREKKNKNKNQLHLSLSRQFYLAALSSGLQRERRWKTHAAVRAATRSFGPASEERTEYVMVLLPAVNTCWTLGCVINAVCGTGVLPQGNTHTYRAGWGGVRGQDFYVTLIPVCQIWKEFPTVHPADLVFDLVSSDSSKDSVPNTNLNIFSRAHCWRFFFVFCFVLQHTMKAAPTRLGCGCDAHTEHVGTAQWSSIPPPPITSPIKRMAPEGTAGLNPISSFSVLRVYAWARVSVSGSHTLGLPCCDISSGWRWSCRRNTARRCRGAEWGRNTASGPSLGLWSEPAREKELTKEDKRCRFPSNQEPILFQCISVNVLHS